MIVPFNTKLNSVAVMLAVMLLASGCSSNPERGPVTEEQELRLIKTYVGAAGIYLQRGQLEYAKEKIDKAMEIDDRNVDVNNIMALYQWRIKQFNEADKYFRRAIDYSPKDGESLNNYAVFLCDRDEIDKAIDYYDRAVAVPLYHSKVQAYTNAGKCLLKKKDNKRAASYFNQALKLNPYYPDAAREMAKLSARSGDLLSARKHISNYFFKGPKTAEMIYLAMRVEETLGKKKAAAKYARDLVTTFPNSREAKWVKKRTKKSR